MAGHSWSRRGPEPKSDTAARREFRTHAESHIWRLVTTFGPLNQSSPPSDAFTPGPGPGAAPMPAVSRSRGRPTSPGLATWVLGPPRWGYWVLEPDPDAGSYSLGVWAGWGGLEVPGPGWGGGLNENVGAEGRRDGAGAGLESLGFEGTTLERSAWGISSCRLGWTPLELGSWRVSGIA